MGFSRSGVLQSQDWPISWRSTITQFIHLFACLSERHRFLICISNECNCVIIVFVETQRAWIAIPLKKWTKRKILLFSLIIFVLRFRFCFRKFMRKRRRRCQNMPKMWQIYDNRYHEFFGSWNYGEKYNNWWSTDLIKFWRSSWPEWGEKTGNLINKTDSVSNIIWSKIFCFPIWSVTTYERYETMSETTNKAINEV